MDKRLQERLNQIPEKVLSTDFLSGKTLGGDISFWIFDYEPQFELEVREYVAFLEEMLSKKHSHLKTVNINLLSALVEYLTERGLLEKATQMQKQKGDDALLKALKGPLHMDKFAPYLTAKYSALEQDLILLTGVGSVWPLLRAHNLLNSLHALLGHKPVVLFYPGQYNGQAMSLFGKIPSNNYYRAFRLAP
jgi:Domain of unknown function (DUF1788).